MAACLKPRDRPGLNNMERCLFCPPCLFHCTGVVGALPAPRHPPLRPTGHSLPRNEIIPKHRCQKALQYSPLPPQIPPPTCLCGQCHSPTHALLCQHTHTHSLSTLPSVLLQCLRTDLKTMGTWTQTCKSPWLAPRNTQNDYKCFVSLSGGLVYI